MIEAGTRLQVDGSLERWIFLDIGFASVRRSCGLAFEGTGATECRFDEAKTQIITRIEDWANEPAPINLLIEAPLSVCFDARGNPKGRTIERQGKDTRYWYCGLGCAVMVAALYLIRSIEERFPDATIRLFEGFVSFKKKDDTESDHARDVNLLRKVVGAPEVFKEALCDPVDLRENETDILQSALDVMGIRCGVPAVIKAALSN